MCFPPSACVLGNTLRPVELLGRWQIVPPLVWLARITNLAPSTRKKIRQDTIPHEWPRHVLHTCFFSGVRDGRFPAAPPRPHVFHHAQRLFMWRGRGVLACTNSERRRDTPIPRGRAHTSVVNEQSAQTLIPGSVPGSRSHSIPKGASPANGPIGVQPRHGLLETTGFGGAGELACNPCFSSNRLYTLSTGRMGRGRSRCTRICSTDRCRVHYCGSVTLWVFAFVVSYVS